MVYLLTPLAPAVKVADLSNTHGCYGLNLEALITSVGQPVCFSIGQNAQAALDGKKLTDLSVQGFYPDFFLPDSDATYHRYFPVFADQLWARNFANGNVLFDIQVFKVR